MRKSALLALLMVLCSVLACAAVLGALVPPAAAEYGTAIYLTERAWDSSFAATRYAGLTELERQWLGEAQAYRIPEWQTATAVQHGG